MIRTTLILTLLILGCGSRDNKSKSDDLTKTDSLTTDQTQSNSRKCNQLLDNKVFEYLYDKEIPEHLFTLIFKCDNGRLTGKIFGPDPEGEHGLWFFRADLENLKTDNSNNIEFEFVKGFLYQNKFTMDNYLGARSTDSAGLSKGRLYYKGQIKGDSIIFNCTAELNDCYDKVMKYGVKN